MDRLMTGHIPESLRAHMAAVERCDPTAMAADYTPDAIIERPQQRIDGRAAICEYFLGVPSRLGGGTVRFDSVDLHSEDSATFHWRIEGGPGDGSSGSDTVQLRDGLISHQQVRLNTKDF